MENLPTAARGEERLAAGCGPEQGWVCAVLQGKWCFRKDGLVAEPHLFSETMPIVPERTSVGFPDHTCPVTAKRQKEKVHLLLCLLPS